MLRHTDKVVMTDSDREKIVAMADIANVITLVLVRRLSTRICKSCSLEFCYISEPET